MPDASGVVKTPVSDWTAWSIAVLAVVFAAGGLVINRADGFSFIALSLIGIGFMLARRAALSTPLRAITWVSAAMLFVAIIAYWFGIQTEIGFREVGRFTRFLGFGPIATVLLLLNSKQRRWIWLSIPIGGILCAVVAAVQVLSSERVVRASGQSFPILFGDLAITTAFFSAFAYIPLRVISSRIAIFFATSGFLGGICASFLSGTRGAWLAIVPVLVVSLLVVRRRLGAKRTASIGALVIGVVLVGLVLPQDGVQSRLDSATNVWQVYFNGRDALREFHPSLGCLDNKQFLETFVRTLRSGENSKASISVVPVKAEPEDVFGKLCSLKYAIEFNNRRGERGAWLAFGRGLSGLDAKSRPALLVRGKGWARAAMPQAAREPFSFSKFGLLRLQPLSPNTSIGLSVRRGGEIAFIPVATVKGEYFFNYADSSVGLRFEMWRAAWNLFRSKPIFGVGMGGFHESVKSLVKDGIVAPAIAQFDHPHNEYLAVLSSRGLLGFIMLLLLFFLVGNESFRGLELPEAEVVAASGCGLVLVVGYVIFGLTETVFTHALGIVYFLFFSAFFLTIIHGSRAASESRSKFVVPEK